MIPIGILFVLDVVAPSQVLYYRNIVEWNIMDLWKLHINECTRGDQLITGKRYNLNRDIVPFRGFCDVHQLVTHYRGASQSPVQHRLVNYDGQR